MKTCTCCKQPKSREDFHNNYAAKDGKQSVCKVCAKVNSRAYCAANREKRNAQKKARRAANLEKVRAQEKAYCAANAEKIKARKRAHRAANLEKLQAREREYGKACYASNPEKFKVRHRKSKYGLTDEQFKDLLLKQKNCCAICGFVFLLDGGRTKAASVDHCHVTGKIRGLLCAECNYGLGKFKDSVLFLRAAADYLEKTQ